MEPEKHRGQHPDDGTHQIEGAEQQSCFTGVGGSADARIALNESPVAAQRRDVAEQRCEHKAPCVLPGCGAEEALGGLPEECADASDSVEGQRQYDDHGGREDQELEYVGHHDGPEAADGDVENTEQAEDQDAGGERDTDGRFDDAGDGVEECTRREERDGQKQSGVELLYPDAEPPCDVFGPREAARAVPAGSDQQSGDYAACAHHPLDRDGGPPFGVGDRAPHDEGPGREKTHEERQPPDPPRDVASACEKIAQVVPRAEKEASGDENPGQQEDDGNVVERMQIRKFWNNKDSPIFVVFGETA